LLLGWAAGKRYQNYVLLLFSLVFYAWGGVSYSLIVILSIVFNYFMGRAIHAAPEKQKSRRLLMLCVTGNLLALCVIKYTPFIFENLNALLGMAGVPAVKIPAIKLIPGISFFTFHSISYVADIYRKDSEPQKNIFTMGLYIVFFPQLIAGPIIRYHEIASQFATRQWNSQSVAEGMKRFLIGLTKKVIFSNTFAYPADIIFGSTHDQIDTPLAWFGIICYSLHIYCDFSGYSDMAIGLGKMFGFTFPENFNFPYRAKSIQDFWHRWHMTLSRWFRDYVYIPLGGSRDGTFRTYRNLLIVFFLTGLWHGASWTMVVWGLFHGFFLVMERLALKNILPKLFIVNRIYTLGVVMIAWVFFKSPDIGFAGQYIAKMFGSGGDALPMQPFSAFLTPDFIFLLIVAILFSAGWIQDFSQRLVKWNPGRMTLEVWRPVEYAGTLVLLCVCTLYLTKQGYNPFIYFQF
ncbi:MAG TPA: MBOAT family protein, partial [Bacteroidia bacterium]|nr:MBOAT family protein [Bacteroidia bacterium]